MHQRQRLAGAMILLVMVVCSFVPAHAQQPSWIAADSIGINVSDDKLILGSDAAPAHPAYGQFQRFGLFDAQPQAITPTNQVRVTWSATIPADAHVRVDLRGFGNRWSDWTLNVQSGELVQLRQTSSMIQYRVTLLANTTSPQVTLVQLEPQPSERSIQTVEAEAVAPTYHIRATRMGLVGDRTANGHIIQPNDWFVSLPSFRSLSSRGGNEYMARLSANGKSIVVPVWEVGPWNIHDDYWNVDRERFADLPVGYPEDHAAYYDGYNDGWAEKGRVRFPTAADVGDGAWVALGIPFNEEQGELDITFLWLGSDPGANPEPLPVGTTTPKPSESTPANTVHVDDLSDQFSQTDAVWYEFKCGKGNHAYWTYTTTKADDSTNAGRWKANLATGNYEVSVFVPYCTNGKSDTKSAKYTIYHANGQTTVTVNQAANAGNWVSLGSYSFDGASSVRLSDLAGDKMKAIWFDAVKWELQK